MNLKIKINMNLKTNDASSVNLNKVNKLRQMKAFVDASTCYTYKSVRYITVNFNAARTHVFLYFWLNAILMIYTINNNYSPHFFSQNNQFISDFRIFLVQREACSVKNCWTLTRERQRHTKFFSKELKYPVNS